MSVPVATMVSNLKKMMGYPAVSIEISDASIESLIQTAVTVYAPYYAGTSFVHINFNGTPIRLSDQGVTEVVHVFDSSPYMPPVDSINVPADLNPLFGFGVMEGQIPAQFSTIEMSLMGMSRSERIYHLDRNFRYINGYLYLDNYQGSMEIEVLKTVTCLEDLDTERAISWVFRYSFALTRLAVGLVRRKFTPANAPFTLDGDALVGEANMDRQMLEEQISGTGMSGFFTVVS